MATDLNLNSVHSEVVSDFLQLSRYQLVQRMKSINHCFGSILTFKVREDETYTGDEVRNILCDLQEIVHGEIETELSDCVHTNVLLIQQLLRQAEEWHLTLTANISELENREKLTLIKQFDEDLRKQPEKMNITVTKGKQVIPVEDMNVASALKKEIIRLAAENDVLKARLKEFCDENKLGSELNSNSLDEKHDLGSSLPGETVVLIGGEAQSVSSLAQELEIAQNTIESLKEALNKSESCQESEFETVHDTVQKLSEELETNRVVAAEETEKLRKDLESRESKLRQVQSSLLLAEKELEKKFQATGAYANMKKILVQKNTAIKNLRKKLAQLGQDAIEDEEDEVLEVDDDNDDAEA